VEKLVECANDAAVAWVASKITNAMANISFCSRVIPGDCGTNGPLGSVSRRIPIQMTILSLPDDIVSDYFKCVATLGSASPLDLELTPSAEVLARCVPGHKVRYSIWARITITNGTDSTDVLSYIDEKECGYSTACNCACKR